MENHPLPQDITGFQFKLIGNMTVKQFSYLAVGVILAWITLSLPISIGIRFIFAGFFASLGAFGLVICLMDCFFFPPPIVSSPFVLNSTRPL